MLSERSSSRRVIFNDGVRSMTDPVTMTGTRSVVWRQMVFFILSTTLLFVLSIAPTCLGMYCDAAPVSTTPTASVKDASTTTAASNTINIQSPLILSMITTLRKNSSGNENGANGTIKSSLVSSSSLSATTTSSIPTPPTVGPIEYATCQIEDLEEANDSQLHSILQELRHTTFFKTFLVNLDQKCPLQSWSTTTKSAHTHKDWDTRGSTETSTATTSVQSFPSTETKEDEEYECDGGADELDDDAEPLCTIAGSDDDDDDSDSFQSLFSSPTPFGTKSKKESTTTASKATKPTTNVFESNALFSLSKGGYESKSQQDAFNWNDITDQVDSEITPCTDVDGADGSVSSVVKDTYADTSDLTKRVLPDTFWNDMCRYLHDYSYDEDDEFSVYTKKSLMSDGTKALSPHVVNLLLNPERNTGYNGTHLWRAIYEENCIATSTGDDSHMCLEERVLYRLLSGMHTQTTISIAMNYYPPSKRKNRITWEANPTYFMSKFESNPDHVRNVHFTYAVLLRALHKAKPILYEYISNRSNINTGNTVDDETAIVLVRRLLDSSILKSCAKVFTAFDESLLFQDDDDYNNDTNVNDVFGMSFNRTTSNEDIVSLQKNFKGVFHNVSRILDCVQCQQCKLHGKLTMLGYGTALKILFMKDKYPTLHRNEIVAFINTIAKFSEAIRDVRHLTQLYWLDVLQQQNIAKTNTLTSTDTSRLVDEELSSKVSESKTRTPRKTSFSASIPDDSGKTSVLSLDIVDKAIGIISELGREELIDLDREAELIQLAFMSDPQLLLLAKHYSTDITKFVQFSNMIQNVEEKVGNKVQITTPQKELQPDAIIVGSGLAGMAAALNILDRGGRVLLLEKEHLLGGNSNKASSGINACCPSNTSSPSDSMSTFEKDTIKSAGSSVRYDLVSTLVSNSAQAVVWLRSRVGVDLSLTSQLGGHSDKRTHRPSNGMVGAEIIYGLQKAIRSYEKKGTVEIKVDHKVLRLLSTETGTGPSKKKSVVGVEYVSTHNPNGPITKILSPNVILATGGFASDRSHGSYLQQYRPELLHMPTTAGSFSTGDGVTIGLQVGAGIVDMDKVQVHPTGWVDPTDPDNTSKTLAAELMRGVGGILMNGKGQRFCNEVGTRAYVTDRMLSHNEAYAKTAKWDISSPIPTFSLVLSSATTKDGAKKHIDLYTRKGLMKRLEGVTELATWMGVDKDAIIQSLQAYQNDAAKGIDEYGKSIFRNLPGNDLDKEIFYAGTVTPVLHYCMGGLTIDKQGNVLDNETNEPIHGLHAAGEVAGGVHGVNRLGGNSLLECTVFGTIVGQKIAIQTNSHAGTGSKSVTKSTTVSKTAERVVTLSELVKNNIPESCWVTIHGVVYDLTDFADEHPAGSESIHELCGMDGTDAFDAVHNEGLLEDFDDVRMGSFEKK